MLFATRYHELTDLARSKARVRTPGRRARVKGDVVFLRHIVEGPASQSYGIQVAKLAGVPTPIIERAGQILHNLERNELTDNGQPRLALDGQPAGGAQLGLFAGADDRLRDELAAIDVDRLAPVEALNRLHELVTRARRG